MRLLVLLVILLAAPGASDAADPPRARAPVRTQPPAAAQSAALASEMQRLALASRDVGVQEQRTNALVQEAMQRAREVMATPPQSRTPQAAEQWAAAWTPKFQQELASVRAEAAAVAMPDLAKFPLISAAMARTPGGLDAGRQAFAKRKENLLSVLQMLDDLTATATKAATGDEAALSLLAAAPTQFNIRALKGEIANWDMAALIEPPESVLAPIVTAMASSDRGLVEVNELIVGVLTGVGVEERAGGERVLVHVADGRRQLTEAATRLEAVEKRLSAGAPSAADVAKAAAASAVMRESMANESEILDQLELIGKRLIGGEEIRAAVRENRVEPLVRRRVELNVKRAQLLAN